MKKKRRKAPLLEERKKKKKEEKKKDDKKDKKKDDKTKKYCEVIKNIVKTYCICLGQGEEDDAAFEEELDWDS
jgi:hypothetical protein